jgi:hypothetical protein
MKFRHVNIKNMVHLVPPWAGEVISAARLLDRCFDSPELKSLVPTGVRAIRLHASFGKTPQEIVCSVGARHERQVRNVLRGSTYSRIRGVEA